ncbi:MAG: carboxypeptidase-like regulatory domain-containing protein [Planctomycetota bacterium]
MPDDPVGLLLYGVVFGPDNKPLKYASIKLVSLEDGRRLSAAPYPDSGYAIAGLRPGEWRLRVTTTGYRSIHRKMTLGVSPARVRLDLHLESAAKVEVSLRTPDGKPLRQALRKKDMKRVRPLIHAFAEHPGARLPPRYAYITSSSTERSRWSSRKTRPDSDGTLEVLIDTPCYVAAVLGEAVLDCKPFDTGQELVRLVVPLEKVAASLGSIHVRVVAAESGAALERVSVRAGNASSYQRKPPADGAYHLQQVRPGRHRLSVSARGRGTHHRWVRVSAGQKLNLKEVLLRKESNVEGNVIGPDGTPAQVSVVLRPLDAAVPSTVYHSSGTSAKGRFKIRRIVPGDYQLMAYSSSKNLYGYMPVTLRSGQNVVADLAVVSAGRLNVEASGLSRGKYRVVRIRSQRGHLLQQFTVYQSGTKRVLPPGSHSYQILDRQERILRSGTLEIGAEPGILHVN